MMKLLGYVAVSLLAASMALAQQDVGSSASRQTGTIEVLQQDAGYVEISGQRYTVDEDRTQVFVDQKVLRLHQLDNGMVVSYSTDADGTLLRIDILGPADKLRELERS